MSSNRESFWTSAHDSALEIKLPKAKSDRITYVDSSRGILIILMLVVHAATPCIEPIREEIQGLWILDIATKGFVMMAGYTFGIVYSKSRPPAFGKLLRRCFELLIVMFFSNVLLTLVRLAWAHEVQTTVAWTWFVGLFTLQTQYNISGVLLPIALLLPLMFIIYRMEQRWGLAVTMLSAIGMLTITYAWSSLVTHGPIGASITEVGFEKGAGGFPVVPYMSYGVLGFFTARLFHSSQARFTWVTCVIVLPVALVAYLATSFDALSGLGPTTLLMKYIRTEAMFLMILGSGIVVSLLSSTTAKRPLNILGHYALFTFILHRLIGHATILAFDLHDGGYPIFVFQFTAVLILTYLICFWRMHVDTVDRFFSRLLL